MMTILKKNKYEKSLMSSLAVSPKATIDMVTSTSSGARETSTTSDDINITTRSTSDAINRKSTTSTSVKRAKRRAKTTTSTIFPKIMLQ